MQNLLILLPCAASLFWFVIYLVLAPAGRPYSKVRGFFLVMFLFFFVALTPIVDKGESPVVLFTILQEFLGTLLIPMALLYLYDLREEPLPRANLFFGVTLLVPAVLLVAATMAAYISGFQESKNLILSLDSGHSILSLGNKQSAVFVISTTYAYKAIVVLNFLLLSVVTMVEGSRKHYSFRSTWDFFFGHGTMKMEGVQNSLILVLFFFMSGMMILGKSYSADKHWLLAGANAVLTVIISVFGITSSFNSRDEITFSDILGYYRFGGTAVPVSKTVAPAETLAAAALQNVSRIPESEVMAHAESVRQSSVYQDNAKTGNVTSQVLSVPVEDRLNICFEDTLVHSRLFLQQKVSAQSVAQMLDVDKNLVADYVMETYGMTFLNYLNMLRIDYAEQYMLNNREATQKQVAMSCGFPSASSFNLAFSKYTGVTPKIWLDRYVEMTQRNETLD